MNAYGKLYLIPTTLGEMNPEEVLPVTVKRTLEFIDYYIVENEKTARRFIKSVLPEKKTTRLKAFRLKQTHGSYRALRVHQTVIGRQKHGFDE